MRRITVNANQKALVTKNERLIYVLDEGKHWIGFGCNVSFHAITQPIQVNQDWDLLLEHDALRDAMEIVEIKEDEIVLEYKSNLYNRVLTPSRVAYWKGSKFETRRYDVNEMIDTNAISSQVLRKSSVLVHLNAYKVAYYEKGLLFVEGKYIKTLDPGVYYAWKAGKSIEVRLVDLRAQTIEVNGQEILTKDKVGVRVNYTAQYKVDNVSQALIETKDFRVQMYAILQLGLRSYIGTLTLDQLLTNKVVISDQVRKETEDVLRSMGVEFLGGGIKDIILPGDVRDIMNQVLVAQKKAQANTIMRQEETASTRSLLNTAKLMENNTMLMKLKEMEYMEKIANSIGEITVNGGSQVMDQLRDLILTK